jgi:hypothetical protein
VNRCSATGVLLAVMVGGLFGGAVALADGERPIRLDLRGLDAQAPVSAGEVQAALALRASLVTESTVDAVDVVVTSPEPGQLEITTEGRLRRVELGAATGADAARLAALIIVDVVRSGAGPFPAPAPVTGTATRPPPATGGSRWAVAASVGLGVRTTDAGPGLAPGLELRLALGGRGRVLLAGAFERAEVAIDGGARGGVLAMTSIPVRAAAGLRFGWAEVRAGVVARPYWLTGIDARSGTQWGGFVAGVAELPTHGPLAAFAVAGVDLVPRPVAFVVGEQRILTFQTFAPFFAVGGVWRGRRG